MSKLYEKARASAVQNLEPEENNNSLVCIQCRKMIIAAFKNRAKIDIDKYK